jgi:hypothetical protein
MTKANPSAIGRTQRLFLILAAAALTVSRGAAEVSIKIEADHVVGPVSRLLTGACIEDVNHEIYGGIYSQMVFGESFQEPPPPRTSQSEKQPEVSRMWRPTQRGTAAGQYSIVLDQPFVGKQSQQISFDCGNGEWGIENQGLNRVGLNFEAGKPYEGLIWARAAKKTKLFVTLESRDGSQVYAETPIVVGGHDWQRLDFTFTPRATDRAGRFTLKLKQPGAVTVGYAFLQPGAWGRFKGLPVRRDVAEGLISQGITVLRYGGSMVNNDGYRWKNMIGPRDRRPPYSGTWYPYSSDGWGIVDFMNFCEAAGFEYVPAFNMGETPQDMVDFIEYAKGASDTKWGRRRVADGHPKPYRIRCLELGNEERVDAKYAEKFEALAGAIWSKDKEITPVVGDFAYAKPIQDPFNFTGADSRITTLAGQHRILRFAKANDCEVWFDVHVGTEQPVPVNATLAGMFSFADALHKLAEGARHRVVVFEFNAGNHAQKRALANAQAIIAVERDGCIPIATSANGLQPDGQNDNGWNQGLLFLNPSSVWLQPPGYVTQIISRNYLPQLVKCEVSGGPGRIDACATRSEDGKTLVLQTVNPGQVAVTARISVAGLIPTSSTARVTVLASELDAVNTAEHPNSVLPEQSEWRDEFKDGVASHSFPPHSFTVIRLDCGG